MRVLIVANFQHGFFAPFITEQVDALQELGIEFDYFPVVAKGILGYIKLRGALREKIKLFQPDIIHAHYGLSCLLANLQRKVPVVSTYHGSDINVPKSRFFSKLAIRLSAYNIFVSKKIAYKANAKNRYSIIPCGVDNKIFYNRDKNECREYFNFERDKIYVLFSKAFHVKIKNYPLAKAAVDLIDNAELIELKGYSREEVAMLMNACDVAVMTSFSEGSPQFVKEAVMCGCPVVSTDVGDVGDVAKDCNSIFICSYEISDIVNMIKRVLKCYQRNTPIYNKFQNKDIAFQIENIYKKTIEDNE